MAVVAAQQYQQNLEAHFVNDESYITPIAAQLNENTCSPNVVHNESDLLQAETTGDNEQHIVAKDNNSQGSEIVCTNISTYLASLPGLNTAYIQQCIHWRPRPTAISNNRARIALRFLSSTCAGDGLSRNHMKGILKFIKILRRPDGALLPKSIDTC